MADKSRTEDKPHFFKIIQLIQLRHAALSRMLLKMKSWRMISCKEVRGFLLRPDILKKFKNRKYRFHQRIILRCLNLIVKNQVEILVKFKILARIMIWKIWFHKVHLAMLDFQNSAMLNNKFKIRLFSQIYPRNFV